LQKTILNSLKFIGFLSVGLGILYVVYNNQNTAYQAQCALDGVPSADCSLFNKIVTDFGRLSYAWIAVVVACFMLSNWSRASRWKMLIEPLGHQVSLGNAFWTVNLGYFANLGLPRMGEVVRAASMSRYEKIPLEKLMGTIVVDRILDVLCLLVVVALAFFLEYDTLFTFLSGNMNKDFLNNLIHNPIIIGLLVCGVLGMSLLVIFWKKILQTAIGQKIWNLLKGFGEGILAIRNAKNPMIFLFHTFNIWFMYYLMAYFCFKAFPPTAALSPVVALMVYTFGAFGVLIPSPGGMGTYHALVTAALTIYGVNGSDGFSFANIFFFSVNIFGSIAFGILALILLPILNREKVTKYTVN
jgi:glycosyltransferase 2 family protein